jgi:hypothetical protein
MLHTLRVSLQNAFYFVMLPFLVPVLFTFYINLNVKLRCQKVNSKPPHEPQPILTSALRECVWIGNSRIEGWVSPRAGMKLTVQEKSLPFPEIKPWFSSP